MSQTVPANSRWAGDGSEITRVFLLTDTDVLVQDEATSLWRAIPTQSEAPGSLTQAQLRNLKRMHPAYQNRLSRAGTAGGKMEIYDPLTASWAAVPRGATHSQVGDTVCCELPDGRLLIGGTASSSHATYDPGTDCWSTNQSRAARNAGQARRSGGPASVIAVRVSG